MILNGTIKVIIPTIAIAELLWKMRKWGELPKFRKALESWKHSPNILIDSFDLTILESMVQNTSSEEIHDEVIAMTCKKHNVNIIYSNDDNFEQNYGLTLRTF